MESNLNPTSTPTSESLPPSDEGGKEVEPTPPTEDWIRERLMDYQRDHFNRVLAILTYSIAYLDTSPTGRGKTVVTILIALILRLKLIVVCPISLQENWRREAEKYGATLLMIIGYHRLRGTTDYPPAHGLLRLDDGEYYPTPDYLEMIKSGILVVFDESQNVKNDSAQTQAAFTLVRTMVLYARGAGAGHRSRVATLSHTPADKPIHIESICKILGLCTYNTLFYFDIRTRICRRDGIQEVINVARRFDPKTTDEICRLIPRSRKEAETFCFNLYTRVLRLHFSSAMPQAPNDGEVRRDARNGFFWLDGEDLNTLARGLSMMREAVVYNEKINTVFHLRGSWRVFIRSLILCERAYLKTIYRLTVQELERDPNRKVIIYLRYIRHIETLARVLEKYKPLVMYGKTTSLQRDAIVERFQRPTNEFRLLISNPAVGGVGLNLDDRHGDFGRTVFLCGSYDVNADTQAIGRPWRVPFTKSSVKIRFVYSQEFRSQLRVFLAMESKSNVLKQVQSLPDGIIFPGEFESDVEEPPSTDPFPPDLSAQINEYLRPFDERDDEATEIELGPEPMDLESEPIVDA